MWITSILIILNYKYQVVDYSGGRTLEDFVAFLDGDHDAEAEDDKADEEDADHDEL